MIIEGEAQLDRIDDSGDVYALVVCPTGEEGGQFVAIEVQSVLGDNWWTEHDAEIPHNHGLADISWVADQHPGEVRDLLGKRLRVTIEVLD